MDLTRPTFILLDTNVGIHEARFLQTLDGKRLTAFMRASGVKLLMPQVLVSEYTKHFGDQTAKHVNQVEGGMGVLGSLWDWRLRDKLPDAASYSDAAKRHFEALSDCTYSPPMTEKVQLAAVARHVAGSAPTGMKDGLIWETILDLEPGALVYFTSKDVSAFFGQDRKTIHKDLLDEASARAIEVKGFGANAGESAFTLILRALRDDFADPALWPEPQAEDLHPMRGRLSTPAALGLSVALPSAAEPAPAPTEPTAHSVDAVAAHGAPPDVLTSLLTSRRGQFQDAEVKALGFVTFLKSDAKDNVIDLLGQSGMVADLARNVLDRLVLMGLVRDSGHSYLSISNPATGSAMEMVADEIAALLTRKR